MLPKAYRTLRIVLIAIVLHGSVSFVVAADRPNVILIMADDQGYGDFGATGNPVIRTPHIDRLADESASMAQFYVSPVCSPTRASLMTGRYNFRTRCIDTWLGRSMMEPDEVTIAEVLAEAGYATGIFGKWHLGDCYPMRPNDQGFQEALVHRGGGLGQPGEPLGNNRRYTDPILIHNGEETQTQGYCTDVYFRAAEEFIEDARKQGKNFFIYLPTNAPHDPYHDVPEDLRKEYLEESKLLAALLPNDQSSDKTAIDKLSRIAAMITNIDDNVGRLRKFLEEKALSKNTIVIYLTDNGPVPRRFVSGMRGRKSEVHEGGIRSPLWICWPEVLSGTTEREEISAHIDLMPTILEACQVTPPSDLKLDGRSLWPLLTNQKKDWPDRSLVIQAHRGDQPLRYHHFMIRDQRWKLLHSSGFHREQFNGKPKFELYDLNKDPGEKENLLATHPEEVNRLKAEYDQWFDDVSSTRPDNYAPPRIHLGAAAEPTTVLTRQDWRGKNWKSKTVGKWLLCVEQKGMYRIEVHMQEGEILEEVHLQFGDSHQTVKSHGESPCVFSGVELEGGLCEGRVWSEESGKRFGAHQVMITKQ